MADHQSLASLLEKEALQVAARRGKGRKDGPPSEVPTAERHALEAERDQALQRITELEEQLQARPTLEAWERSRQRIADLESQLKLRPDLASWEELQVQLRAAPAPEELENLKARLEEAEARLASAPQPEELREAQAARQELQSRISELEARIRELQAQPAAAQSNPELERMAYEDRLTGLPNGNLLAQFLRHSLAAGGEERKAVGVIVVDFDHFKRINDRFGPELGDRLIQRAGALLRQGLPQEAVVGRRGEDEFTIVLAVPERGEAALQTQLHRLCVQVGQAVGSLAELDGQSVGVTATLGVSTMYSAGSDPDQLIKQAETALYRGKELGRNRTQAYDASLHSLLQLRRERQHQFYEACQQGRVRPRYRAVVGLRQGSLIGAELLLEWRSTPSVRGSALDELVEQCGLSSYLGNWVLEQACVAARTLGRERHVIVRLFPGQLLRPDFADRVLKIVSQNGIEPSQLCLEPHAEDYHFDSSRFRDAVDSLIRWQMGLVCSDVSLFLGAGDFWFKTPRCYLRVAEEIVSQTPDGEPGAPLCAGLVRLADRSQVMCLADGVSDREQAEFLRLLECTAAVGELFGEFGDPGELLSLA